MYNEEGETTWQRSLDSNGAVKTDLEELFNNHPQAKTDAWRIFDSYSSQTSSSDGQEQIEYPQLPLATSDLFFGFDDLGDMEYEEQEATAMELFNSYTAELSALLGAQPASDLASVSFDVNSDAAWETYFERSEEHAFIHDLHSPITAWKKDDKALFLVMQKEDKELPYEIALGGMALIKYQEMLALYNGIGSKSK